MASPSVTPATTPASATKPAANTPKVPATDRSLLSSDFETFLKMLTAQARYQDPLEPLDSTEYAAQLAQFSSVEQQVKSNDLLSGIASQLGAGNMVQFASWIGMEGRSTAPTFFDGTPIKLHTSPASSADQVWLVVRDAQNNVVQRKQLSTTDGPSYSWPGTDNNGNSFANGLYQFAIESHANGKLIRTDGAETYSRITETRTEGGKPVLVLKGGSVVKSTDITALREAS